MKTPNRIETPPMSARAQAAAAWIALYLKWKKRFESWAEFLGKFWAAYWLLILGSFLILGSVFLKWVQYPISSNLSGLELPLFHDTGVIPHVALLSFGALGIVVLIAGVVLLRFFVSALSLAAAVLITLCVLTPAHIAFQQPMMLRHLTDELQAMPWHKMFTKDYLPQNYGSPEVVPNQLILYTASGRLLAAFSFLRLGFTCFALGSLLVALYAMRRLPDRKMATGLALVCLPVGALAVVITPPIIGQHYFTSGSIAKAQGLALYQAGGIGGAVTSWQLALANDPTQEVYVLPYLARGYFELARYEAALQTVNRLVKIIADHSSMVADVYSLGGDCYAKLGRDADARHYYNLSYAADWIVNYWAISRLAGE